MHLQKWPADGCNVQVMGNASFFQLLSTEVNWKSQFAMRHLKNEDSSAKHLIVSLSQRNLFAFYLIYHNFSSCSPLCSLWETQV